MRPLSHFHVAVIGEPMRRAQECVDGLVRRYVKHKTSRRSNWPSHAKGNIAKARSMVHRSNSLWSALLCCVLLLTTHSLALAQNARFNPGDRVECDKAHINSWELGTVMPYLKLDDKSGQHYRVRLDAHARGGMYLEGIECRADKMRPALAAAAYRPEPTSVAVGKATVDGDNTLSADRPILSCPVEQKSSKNGSAPNPEVLKKVLRCRLGEKAAAKGYDGAVTIDVTALQVGARRPWDRLQDKNGGTPGSTFVYPVKVNYSSKTFYRSSTAIGDDWIVIFNFFVDGFGEWQYGSAETLKMPDNKNIPREK